MIFILCEPLWSMVAKKQKCKMQNARKPRPSILIGSPLPEDSDEKIFHGANSIRIFGEGIGGDGKPTRMKNLVQLSSGYYESKWAVKCSAFELSVPYKN